MVMEDVINQWGDALVRLGYRYLADSAEAQDIAQEALTRYYQHWVRTQHLPSVGWLYTVARHLAIDEQRRRNRALLITASLPSYDRGFEDRVNDQLTVEAIREKLAPLDQLCVWLFYDEESSINEIAALLKKSPASIRVRLLRARRRFAQGWKGVMQHG